LTLLFVFVIPVIILLLLLGWALYGSHGRVEKSLDSLILENLSRRHVHFLPQIQQALSPQDYSFLASQGSNKLARRVRHERRRVAFAYLAAIQAEFRKLLKLARLIALLSPHVVAVREFEQLRLSCQFSLRCQWIRARLILGPTPFSQLNALSNMVSGLSARLETAINELGERAALASELASSSHGRGVNLS
jgi:hypothetical protein